MVFQAPVEGREIDKGLYLPLNYFDTYNRQALIQLRLFLTAIIYVAFLGFL
jgi:hypothetical protein